jgi:hypothetical protein
MKVFIVIAGEDNQGGSVEGVFASADAARQFVKNRFVGRDFVAAFFDEGHERIGDVDRWENSGCDWIEIQPHEVQ